MDGSSSAAPLPLSPPSPFEASSSSWDGVGVAGGLLANESASSFDAAATKVAAAPISSLQKAVSDSWVQAQPPPLPPQQQQQQQQRASATYQNPYAGWNQQYYHDQRDASQHSRGSIWVEEQSRSSASFVNMNGSRSSASTIGSFIFGDDFHSSHHNNHNYNSSPEVEKECLPQGIAHLSLQHNPMGTGLTRTRTSLIPTAAMHATGNTLGSKGLAQTGGDMKHSTLSRQASKEISTPYLQNQPPPPFSPVIGHSTNHETLTQQQQLHQHHQAFQDQNPFPYQMQRHSSYHPFAVGGSSVATVNTYSTSSVPGLLQADSGSTSGATAAWSVAGTISNLPNNRVSEALAIPVIGTQPINAPGGQAKQPPPGFEGIASRIGEEVERDIADVVPAAIDPIQGSRQASPPSALLSLTDSSSLCRSPLPVENCQSNRRNGGGKGRGRDNSSGNTSNQNNKNRQRNNRNKKSQGGGAAAGRGPHQFPLKEQSGAMNTKLESTASPSSTLSPSSFGRAVSNESETLASSEAIRQLMKPPGGGTLASIGVGSMATSTTTSTLYPTNLDESMEQSSSHAESLSNNDMLSILPHQPPVIDDLSFDQDSDDDDILFQYGGDDDESEGANGNHNNPYGLGPTSSPRSKKREWLLRMNRKLSEIAVGDLDPSTIPLPAIMNAWAKTKSAQGASMVEMWLKRAQQEYDAGNSRVVPTTKMYTMAVDAWARSGEGGAAAQRAEALLQQMNDLYQAGEHEALRPTTGIFNAVINAWARSREKIAPLRAEQILNWMHNLQYLDVQPDKYTFNTVIHAWAKAGGTEAAAKAQELLTKMHKMYQEGDILAKPDTITYNVVINAWAKSGGKGAASEAEKLLSKMHALHKMGDPDVKPNVVTYGAVIDSFAKSGEPGAASRADTLLANMIQLHQSDPIRHADLLPNTYVFNTVINCWAKSKEHDAASKAEEMLVAMSRLHASGMPSLKPDAFTYTAVIDAWAKSGYRGAAARADQLLDKMEAKYLAGDVDLKPNTFTYNAVINALAKSGEAGAAARAERVLQNMVNRHRNGGGDDVKPTTINFNTVLDAWAKSGGGRAAAERAEEILEWMDRLHKGGNADVKPDTITFNAVLDAWARSGDRIAPRRAEQILDHMDELHRAGNNGVKPDTYTYNTLINAWAKSGERGAAARAEHVLSIMEKRYRDGDRDFKPNTRTHTSVIDAWAKSGEKGAARRAEQILNNMISRYDATGDPDIKPNVHTANAVCNACAFSKHEDDRAESLQIAFRVFDWLSNQADMKPDSYTYTILLSVCANLLPREDGAARFAHARAFFESCRDAGYVNDYVLRKLRQTVTDHEYLRLVDYRSDPSASSMPSSWTRNAKIDARSKGRKAGNSGWSNRRKGK